MPEEQKQWLLPRIAQGGLASLCVTEATAGSDATGMKTQFRPDGDTIIVGGEKTFITNGDVADLYLRFGKWSGIDDAKGAISALIVEKGTPGLRVLRTETNSAIALPGPLPSPSTNAACRVQTCSATRAMG